MNNLAAKISSTSHFKTAFDLGHDKRSATDVPSALTDT